MKTIIAIILLIWLPIFLFKQGMYFDAILCALIVIPFLYTLPAAIIMRGISFGKKCFFLDPVGEK